MDIQKKLIVCGIGTEVGKTVVSAILVQALQADYWKPVQTGYPEDSDTRTVQALVSNSKSIFHPETYCYKAPMSPHAAAALDNDNIVPEKIIVPQTNNQLIIELAGGLMVPLTQEFLNIHLIKQLNAAVVLVANYYLGSINHTLLTLEVLRQYKIPVLGIIFNGNENTSSRQAIEAYSGVPIWGHISQEKEINKSIVSQYAKAFQPKLKEYGIKRT